MQDKLIIDILFVLLLIASAVINIFSILWSINAEKYVDIIKQYMRYETSNKELLKYCLSHIYNESIKLEDYEKAQKCKELLETLNQQ